MNDLFFFILFYVQLAKIKCLKKTLTGFEHGHSGDGNDHSAN